MSAEKYHKRQIATDQLKTAIWLFLHGRDPASVITLAGAASAILHQLVHNEGKTPFVDFARNVHNAFGGRMVPRTKYQRHINDTLGINSLKHMSAACPDTLEIDLEKNAEDAITRAIADYVPLFGQEHDFIKAYLQWAWVNRNGPQIMKDYEKIPAKLKRK
jgi:hypothetical protein